MAEEEVQASMEFLDITEDAQQMSYEAWVDDLTLLTDGQHSVRILKEDVLQSRDVDVVRSLDTLELTYMDGDWEYHLMVKPSGRMYTTKTYKGTELGVPKSVSTKGLWRFLS